MKNENSKNATTQSSFSSRLKEYAKRIKQKGMVIVPDEPTGKINKSTNREL